MELKYTYWQGEGWLIGRLDDHPKYKTQGKNLKELEEMLVDLYENIKIEEAKEKTIEQKQGIIKIPA